MNTTLVPIHTVGAAITRTADIVTEHIAAVPGVTNVTRYTREEVLPEIDSLVPKGPGRFFIVEPGGSLTDAATDAAEHTAAGIAELVDLWGDSRIGLLVLETMLSPDGAPIPMHGLRLGVLAWLEPAAG